MSLTSSNRLMPLGRSLIPLDLPFAAKLSAFKRALLDMDDLSRFQYAVVASFVVHAIVLFGVTFRPPDLSKLDSVAPALEVVLVNSRSMTRPEHADAIAQHNLDGGGNTDLDRQAKTPLPVMRSDQQANELSVASRRVQQLEVEAKKLLTQVQSPAKVETAVTQPESQTDIKIAPNAANIMNNSLESIRLEAQIAKDHEAYQKRPRRKFLGGRTQEFRFAQYIEDWRQKIERIGTFNYPEAAKSQKIYGSLRLTVSIRSDGSVDKVEIDKSSGKKILDDAAIRIVNLAAPYAAFPADISKDTDILGITKTWTFTISDRLTTE